MHNMELGNFIRGSKHDIQTRVFCRVLLLVFLACSVPSCAYVTFYPFGSGIEPVPEKENQYTFRLFWNALATVEDVQNEAKRVIEEFVAQNNFQDYEIIDSTTHIRPAFEAKSDYWEYVFEVYSVAQNRKLTKLKTKQDGFGSWPIRFTDDNPEFENRLSSVQSVVLLVDFTSSHFDASAKSGRDAIIDVAESEESAYILASDISNALETAGYEVREVVRSSGWSTWPDLYRVRRTPSDRNKAAEELPKDGRPFYLDERHTENQSLLDKAYNDFRPSTTHEFVHAQKLADKYGADILFMILGYAVTPTSGSQALGALNSITMSSRLQGRVWMSRTALEVAAQIIDAESATQIGFFAAETFPENSVDPKTVSSMAQEILDAYPAHTTTDAF